MEEQGHAPVARAGSGCRGITVETCSTVGVGGTGRRCRYSNVAKAAAAVVQQQAVALVFVADVQIEAAVAVEVARHGVPRIPHVGQGSGVAGIDAGKVPRAVVQKQFVPVRRIFHLGGATLHSWCAADNR